MDCPECDGAGEMYQELRLAEGSLDPAFIYPDEDSTAEPGPLCPTKTCWLCKGSGVVEEEENDDEADPVGGGSF